MAAVRQTAKNEIYPKSRRAGTADVRPSGSAGDSATARLWIRIFRLVAVRTCACLGERSEPTCIRQAHVTVPRWKFTKYSTAICIPIDELVIAFSYRICYDDIIIQIRSELWRHLITMVNETKKCKIHSLIEPIVRNRLLTFLLEGCTI